MTPRQRLGAAGFDLPVARWTLVFVWATGVVHGVTTGTFSAQGVLGVVAYGANLLICLILTSGHAGPLRRWQSLLLLALTAVVDVIVLIQVTDTAQPWLLQYTSYLVVMAIPRGNVRTGVVGGALMLTLTLWWAIGSGADAEHLTFALNPVIAVLVGLLWLSFLRRTVAREIRAESVAEHARNETKAAEAAERVYRAELGRIDTIASPVLRFIAEGRPVDAAARHDLAVTEATVRDRIRVPQLQDPVLIAAIERARRRDVTVVLIGEPDVGSMIGLGQADRLAREVDRVRSGTVTIRALPPGRADAVTLVARSDEGEVHRYVVPAAGRPLEPGDSATASPDSSLAGRWMRGQRSEE